MRQTSPSGVVPLIKFVDMFSGIGGFREGLTRAGGFECVGHCEIDKYANRSYNALFDTKGEWFIVKRRFRPRKVKRENAHAAGLASRNCPINCGNVRIQVFQNITKNSGVSNRTSINGCKVGELGINGQCTAEVPSKIPPRLCVASSVLISAPEKIIQITRHTDAAKGTNTR